MEILLKYWGIFATVGSWLALLTGYFIRNHFKLATLDKMLTTLQQWVTTFQKTNTEKHEEFHKTLEENQDKAFLERRLLRSELENRMLHDKQETSQQIAKMSEKLDNLGPVISKMAAGDEHIIKTLDRISLRLEKQDQLNLDFSKEISRKNK